MIYLKNRSIQEGKVVEVTTEKIKYKKAEIPNGPTYELLKNDVIKIVYPNGYTDVIDTSITIKAKSAIDTASFSIIYVLFHYGQDDSQYFPLYFNGQYICTMKNYMRMKFKIYSDGVLSCERRSGNNSGPSANLVIVHGKIYGISINVPHPYALDPNKRFSLTTYTVRDEVDEFLKKTFYHFKTLNKELDLKEDIKNPIRIK